MVTISPGLSQTVFGNGTPLEDAVTIDGERDEYVVRRGLTLERGVDRQLELFLGGLEPLRPYASPGLAVVPNLRFGQPSVAGIRRVGIVAKTRSR